VTSCRGRFDTESLHSVEDDQAGEKCGELGVVGAREFLGAGMEQQSFEVASEN